MRSSHRPLLAAPLALALLAACAHAPTPAAQAEPAEPPPAVLVTGSRLPQQVDVASGLPRTTSPTRIFTRQQLQATGEPNVADALKRITP